MAKSFPMTNLRHRLTSREAADVLGMSLRTFLRRVEEGAIHPAEKLPGLRGAYLFDRADVERLATEQVA